MPKKVLIVDDDSDVRLFVQAVMEDAGWTTLEAGNGEECCELAQSELPDLIILDVSMPVMDGFAAFKHLRDSPFTGKIPIIMLTAINSEQDKAYTADLMERKFSQPAPEGFVDKPVDATFLLHSVMGIMG